MEPCEINEGRCQTEIDTGTMCAEHAEAQAREDRYYRALWDAASPAERDPAKYAREMVDGGCGEKLTEEERALVDGPVRLG